MSNHPNQVLGSIVVSILACHARDRGSIPRRGDFYFPLDPKFFSPHIPLIKPRISSAVIV